MALRNIKKLSNDEQDASIEETFHGAPSPEVEYEAEKPLLYRVIDAIKEKYDFRMNTVRQTLEFKDFETPQNGYIDFEERDLNSLAFEFELNKEFKGKGERPSAKRLDSILRSRFTPDYNPIIGFFKSLKWDGKNHIKQLTDTVTVNNFTLGGTTTTSMVWEVLFKRWLLACIACGIGKQPNHVMLLFIGKQGTFKTTWMNLLTPKDIDSYSFTGHIDPNLTNKDTANLLAEKFFINIDDQLASLFGKDFNLIKAIITTSSITNRKAFRRDDMKRARIANFCGSVNNETLFQDIENRRYLTFKIDAIDIEAAKKINMNQVWAQAYELMKKNERCYFDADETQLINKINDHYAVISPEQEWLTKLFEPVKLPYTIDQEPPTYRTYSEILSIINLASGLKLSPYHLQRAMTKKGFDNSRISKRTEGGTPSYVYAVNEFFVIDKYGKSIDVQRQTKPE